MSLKMNSAIFIPVTRSKSLVKDALMSWSAAGQNGAFIGRTLSCPFAATLG